MIVLLLISFVIIALISVPKLIREKQWRELIVYSGLFAIAVTLSVLLFYGVPVPSPIKGVQYIIKDVLHLNYK